jgi:hypothetical protein
LPGRAASKRLARTEELLAFRRDGNREGQFTARRIFREKSNRGDPCVFKLDGRLAYQAFRPEPSGVHAIPSDECFARFALQVAILRIGHHLLDVEDVEQVLPSSLDNWSGEVSHG